MKIETTLDSIDLGSIALPEFQRGYVWNRDQVRGLMQSLYRRYPVGSLLVWETKTEEANARGDASLTPGYVRLLLDGQQRITSLYGIIRGRPPKFFEGNKDAFTGLFFNIEEESFEFYAPLKMRDNPLWVDVTALMQNGIGAVMDRIYSNDALRPMAQEYLNRLTTLEGIKKIELHDETVMGEDKTVDVVVDIFNRVNSGGTKLSKGDLALAKICAQWPAARDEMNRRLTKWRRVGYSFRLEWLLRNVNTIVTGEALFSALKDVTPDDFEGGLKKSEKSIDFFLNLVASRLGLDHDRVLGSRFAFPLLSRYYWQRGGKLSNHAERDKLLYWYVQTILWGRYAGSTETVLNQDLEAIEDQDHGLDRLIEELRRSRGDLHLNAGDFVGWSKGARFYPLLYMLTRVDKAKDWDSGIELSAFMLGRFTDLHIHHIFPKALLRDAGYPRSEVNAIANFTFLTLETNLQVSDRRPQDYLPEFVQNPGAVESHWIPMDPDLWRVDRYRDFLAARRELLANAANEFLDSLLQGAIPETATEPSVLDRDVVAPPGGFATPDEEVIIRELNEWVVAQGLPEGEVSFELADTETGEPVAILDLAWHEGLQEGLSQPVAILIDEESSVEETVNRCGFRFFTTVEAFKSYVRQEIAPSGELALPYAGQQLTVGP